MGSCSNKQSYKILKIKFKFECNNLLNFTVTIGNSTTFNTLTYVELELFTFVRYREPSKYLVKSKPTTKQFRFLYDVSNYHLLFQSTPRVIHIKCLSFFSRHYSQLGTTQCLQQKSQFSFKKLHKNMKEAPFFTNFPPTY